MLDINLIREQPDLVRKALADRQMEPGRVDQILSWTSSAGDHPGGRDPQGRAQRRLEGDRADEGPGRAPGEDRGHAAVGDRIASSTRQLPQVEEELNAAWQLPSQHPDARTPYGKDDSENVVLRTVGRAARVRLRAQAALGPGPGPGHPRFRAGRQDHRLALLRAQRGRGAPAAGPDRLDARPAHPPGLHREVHPLHGQGRHAVRRRAAAQVRRQPVPRRTKKTCGWCPTAEVPLTGLHMDEILDEAACR